MSLASDASKRCLRNRIERLAWLLGNNAPSAILCEEIWLVVRAAAMLAPDSMGKVMGRQIGLASRLGTGLCTTCDEGEIEWPMSMCKACLDAAEAEAREFDEEFGEESKPDPDPTERN